LLILLFQSHCTQIKGQELEMDEALVNSYQYLINNPIPLNTCTLEELSQIPFLSPIQINAFFAYRKNQKYLLHIFELQVIPEFDIGTCRKLQSLVFVNINDSGKFKIAPNFILSRFETTLENSIGFTENGKSSHYLGDKLKEFIKIKNNQNPKIHYGLILQKDAGETQVNDFTSAYLEINPKKIFQKIIFGDYSIQWGQGLVQAGGFSLGKNYESIKSTQKFHLGGLPYSSSSEANFNRGIYFHKIIYDFLALQGFLSRKKLDGKLYKIGDQEGFKSIDLDGYHRNLSEITNQSSIEEIKYGLSVQLLQSQRSSFHLNYVNTTYDLPKIPSGIDYKKMEWTGRQMDLWSISNTFYLRNIRWSSEIAYQSSKGISMIHGIALSISKKQDASILFRKFASGFYNPDGNALGENTNNENEYGLFIGHQFQIAKRKRLSSYFDFFYFPNSKYQVSQDKTFGWEFLNRYQLEKKNTFKFFQQIKWTYKQENASDYKLTNKLQNVHDIQESIDFQRTIFKKIQFHNRISLHYLHKDELNFLGFMILQDLGYLWRKLEIKSRIAYIQTPSYDTRLYAFEPGLPYSFSLFSYFGKCSRNTICLEYPIHKNFQLSCKIARTSYFDRETVGSGTDQINQNHKTDLSFQLVYKL